MSLGNKKKHQIKMANVCVLDACCEVAVKAIGGGPGSFLQVKLILKYSIPRSERFLRN